VTLPGAITVRAFGHGDPSIYSGSPLLEVRHGMIGDEREKVVKIPLVKGSFDIRHPIDLTPGVWVITARVIPDSDCDEITMAGASFLLILTRSDFVVPVAMEAVWDEI
jgi:hypothetical protein